MPGSSDQKTSCMHDLGNMQALKHDTSQETHSNMIHLKKPRSYFTSKWL